MRAEIVSLRTLSTAQREAAAGLLVRAFAHSPSAWQDMAAARAELSTFLDNPERLGFAALEGERLVGWIGGVRQSAHAWELHPLVVEPARQRHGRGTLLVAALEAAARRAGVCTLWLGADDDFGGTNLFGQDLYPQVLERLQRLAPTSGHPYTFYRARGYAVVGVLPDFDGIGKHDILMAKRIGPAD